MCQSSVKFYCETCLKCCAYLHTNTMCTTFLFKHVKQHPLHKLPFSLKYENRWYLTSCVNIIFLDDEMRKDCHILFG
jgi:hypothetical protein